MKRVWWKESVVYQVYWRSFSDSNGDGIGDLKGVLSKLDYIQSLGANMIWLNPCYESPDVDNGYDISDYRSVMAKAGTMDDLRDLLAEVHNRGMKLIMDLVVNHTSNQHPWFMESRKSKDNPYRDYYIWRDRPNNWRSYFTPSAWEFDETTGQYYFHSFAIEQPDLNWENPKVRKEVYDLMRYWLNFGVDGFRMDVINLLAKKEGFPDAENPYDLSYLGNQPRIHEYLQEMHREVLQGRDVFTVGEIPFVSAEDGVKYVAEDRYELNTLFHFQILDDMPTWDLKRFRAIQNRWYAALHERGWNSQVLNNHDHTRLVTRYGDDKEYRIQSATCFATMLHSLPGTPFVYQGEEIGMTGVRFDRIEDYQDIAFQNRLREELGKGKDLVDVLEQLVPLARDNSRTPMQWDDSVNAGFTTGTPWIKVNPNYPLINVERDLSSPNSVFHYYQRLIRMRREYDVLVYGDYSALETDSDAVYAYTRVLNNVKVLVVLNLSTEPSVIQLPDSVVEGHPFCLISNENEHPLRSRMELMPYQAGIYLLDGAR